MLLRGVRLFLWLLFGLAFLFDVFTKLIQQFDILKSLHILIHDCCIWMEKDIIVKQVFQTESISMCGIFSPFWASQFFCQLDLCIAYWQRKLQKFSWDEPRSKYFFSGRPFGESLFSCLKITNNIARKGSKFTKNVGTHPNCPKWFRRPCLDSKH